MLLQQYRHFSDEQTVEQDRRYAAGSGHRGANEEACRIYEFTT
jgi:hypothetical protein